MGSNGFQGKRRHWRLRVTFRPFDDARQRDCAYVLWARLFLAGQWRTFEEKCQEHTGPDAHRDAAEIPEGRELAPEMAAVPVLCVGGERPPILWEGDGDNH